MSLPWFAFNVKAYLSDTMRLTTEAHGAYLLLMLDYYETGAPCPDDDFILAAVAKLPVEQWQKHRKVLERFFRIEEGQWFHDRIAYELLEAERKHASVVERAKAGAAAKHAREQQNSPLPGGKRKKVAKPANPVPKVMPEAVPNGLPQADHKHSHKHAHLHKHPSITEGGGEAPPEADQTDQIRFITKDFLPSVETSDRAKAAGMTVEEIDSEVRKFIGRKQSDGAVSSDWQGSFAEWIEREIAYRAKQEKAAPRIEVNNKQFVPTEADYDRAVAMFAKDGSRWSRHLGPEPGMLGCKVPAAIIEKHGLDPVTGMKKKVVKQ